MTRREQFIKSRAWLHMHNFAITNSLRAKLESVPLADGEGYSFIQNHVLMVADEFDGDHFIFIPTTVWKKRLGTGYKRFITQLTAWGELEVNTDCRWSKNKSGYPMSYAIPPEAFATGICQMDFKRQRIRLPRPQNRPNGPVSQYALECLSALRVAETLIYPTPKRKSNNIDIRQSRIRCHCEHIMSGDFSLRYGTNKVQRLYHRVLSMPSEARCNLYHRSGFSLGEYDVKTCHPLLMMKFVTNPDERIRYAEMLSGDIYKTICNELQIDDRDQIKTDFQRVCNCRYKTSAWMAKQPIFQFYHRHFPTFAIQFLFKRNDLAACMQNFEASLMVQLLGKYCRDNNLFWIPMHDGFITRVDQGEVISTQASKIILDAVGLIPEITCSPI